MSCDVGRRHSLDLVWLWLWCRPAAIAPIRSLACEPLHAVIGALKRKKKKSIIVDLQCPVNFCCPGLCSVSQTGRNVLLVFKLHVDNLYTFGKNNIEHKFLSHLFEGGFSDHPSQSRTLPHPPHHFIPLLYSVFFKAPSRCSNKHLVSDGLLLYLLLGHPELQFISSTVKGGCSIAWRCQDG